MLHRSLGVLLAGWLSVMSVAGCAPNGGIDVADLEDQLLTDLLPEHPGVVRSIDCPPEINPEAGDEVTCVATIGASPANVAITFGAGKGIAAATVVDRLVDVVELNRLAAERLSADLELPVQLACPHPVMVINVDDEVSCIATDEQGIERELALMIDEGGEVAVRLNVP